MKTLDNTNTKKSIKCTPKQKKALELVLVDNGRSSKGDILRKAGYSEAVALQPSKVFGSDYFRAVLHEIVDDRALIKKVNEIALDDDKRSALNAIEMLFKLKDRFPAGKIRIDTYNEEIAELVENNEPEAV